MDYLAQSDEPVCRFLRQRILEISGCAWPHLKGHTLPHSDGKCVPCCGGVPLCAEPVRALRGLVADINYQDVNARSNVYFLNFAYAEVSLPRKIRPSAMWDAEAYPLVGLTPRLRRKFHAGLPWREIYERLGEE